MDSPQRQQRREFRYPLHLPVLIRMQSHKEQSHKEMRGRSENISLGGILLSSAFLIPEGAAVEISVGVEHLPDPGIILSAIGKVLRVQPKDTGDFAVAIKLDRGFELPFSNRKSRSGSPGKKPPSSDPPKTLTAISLRPHFALAWHYET
ncbi:MAG: PilZ domain-containing protein [Candidatus Sulfotelmatobacter sp.]